MLPSTDPRARGSRAQPEGRQMKYLMLLIFSLFAFPALADEPCIATKADNGNWLTYKDCSPEPRITAGYRTTIEIVEGGPCEPDRTFEVTREARGNAEVGRKEI